jgi:AcrR family transcriptional regulator
MTGKTLAPGLETSPEDHRVRNGAARKEKSRQRLLSTAVNVFAEKGVDAPSIDDFIAAAGVSRGTFYNHFKSTVELLDAVTAEISDEVIDTIERTVSAMDSPVQRIACGCLMYMQAAVDHPAWGAFVTRTGMRGSASGHLVDVYLPRDLLLAREQGQAVFNNVRSARDVLLGSLQQAIESVLTGAAQREHLPETLGMALRGIGVSQKSVARGLALPLGDIEWPEILYRLEVPSAN